MKKASDETRKKIDLIVKIVLIIIIILLLIHNCTLIKNNNQNDNKPTPNGNVDIIEIECNGNQCKPVPTPTSKPNNTGNDKKTSKEITSLSFAEKNVSLLKGDKQKLAILVKPISLASSKLTWKSSDESIAKVDSNGVIAALKEGKVVITVTSANGISTTCVIDVMTEKVNVSKIVLNSDNITLKIGEANQMVAKIEPENATERDITWSTSDSSVATIDENGVVKALKEGTVTITAKTKDGKVKATCVVNVESIKVDKITLNPSAMALKVGGTAQITSNVEPESATDKELIWTSSDTSVAKVDNMGKVTAIKEGATIITAKTKDGKVESTCTVNVTVETIDVEKITLNPNNITLKVDQNKQIIASIKPENATERDITWSTSDSSVVTVDENGIVTALKPGKATITVLTKDGKVKATCVVNVEAIKVNQISLSPSTLSLKVDGIYQITANVKPENATDKELTWASSDSKVVKVDSNGIVKALKPGKATITAKTKDGKIKATCVVNVLPIEVDKVTLNPNSMNLKVGSNGQIVANIEPKNATDKELVWSSSDTSIAKVDNTGKVTGIKEGTVTITAKTKDGKVKATSVVTITTNVIEVQEIILSMDSTDVIAGTFEQITATIKPENATERDIVWSSSDTSIATVDGTGKVTGIKEGTIIVTAKTKDGKVEKTITITVKNPTTDGDFETYDEEKDPITWNGSDDLKIFSKSIYNLDGVLAPESQNTYQFVVRNNTRYRIKYSIDFIETNNDNINMQYKLKKNDTYIINSYSKPTALRVSEFTLNSGESDTYYLDWKWISSSNDTSVGSNPDAVYKLQIEVKAESING